MKDKAEPKYHSTAFICPHCDIHATQVWGILSHRPQNSIDTKGLVGIYNYEVSQCSQCKHPTIWHKQQIVYPITAGAPEPSEDMPEDVQGDYNEARLVLALSPRSSCALLRLAVQKLCNHLGYTKGNLVDQINGMAKGEGLSKKVIDALHTVRLVGNNAVHPGHLDLTDGRDIALLLFNLLNIIVASTITLGNGMQSVRQSLSAASDGVQISSVPILQPAIITTK